MPEPYRTQVDLTGSIQDRLNLSIFYINLAILKYLVIAQVLVGLNYIVEEYSYWRFII